MIFLKSTYFLEISSVNVFEQLKQLKRHSVCECVYHYITIFFILIYAGASRTAKRAVNRAANIQNVSVTVRYLQFLICKV